MADSNRSSAPSVAEGPLSGLRGAVFLLGAITTLRLAALSFHALDLYPDEAQYWTWSRDRAFGYFSKPPVIAWLIAASTAVCGAGEGCIKAAIPLVYFATSLLVYGIGRRLYNGRVGLFAALAFITLPGVAFSATVASTDPPLLMGWALGLYALVRLAQGEAVLRRWWAVLGLAIGFGLLSKYAMVFFIVGLLLWIVLDGEARRRLALAGAGWRRLAGALALGGLIYLPNLWWNYSAGFVTFVHTGANANLKGSLFHPEKLAEFVATQFGVFGPILFAVLLTLLARPWRWGADWRHRLLAAFIVPMLATITTLALVSRANANWAAPVYVAGTVWVTAALLDGGRRIWAVVSLALHGTVAALLVVAAAAQMGPGNYGGLRVPRGLDPFANYDGWREAADRVTETRARFPGVPLLSIDRKLTAELLYYVRPWPDDLYAWRADGRITDHFKLTRPLRDVPGGDYLLVTPYEDSRDITGRFRDSTLVGAYPVSVAVSRARHLRIFHLRGFLGYKAAQSSAVSVPSETRKGQAVP